MYPINVVEKETGINKYLLRMWERRYSFPRPQRDEKGERLYSDLDVEKLNVVKALMHEGYRPSKIINQNLDELKKLLSNLVAKNAQHNNASNSTIVLLTNPELEAEVLSKLQNQNVKKILRVTTSDDLLDLAL